MEATSRPITASSALQDLHSFSSQETTRQMCQWGTTQRYMAWALLPMTYVRFFVRATSGDIQTDLVDASSSAVSGLSQDCSLDFILCHCSFYLNVNAGFFCVLIVRMSIGVSVEARLVVGGAGTGQHVRGIAVPVIILPLCVHLCVRERERCRGEHKPPLVTMHRMCTMVTSWFWSIALHGPRWYSLETKEFSARRETMFSTTVHSPHSGGQRKISGTQARSSGWATRACCGL